MLSLINIRLLYEYSTYTKIYRPKALKKVLDGQSKKPVLFLTKLIT